MRLRFKTALVIIFIMIAGCVTLGIGSLFYVKVFKDDAVVIVDGDITINYLNGNEFYLTDTGSLDFSVTNNGSKEAYYYIQLSDIKGNVNDVTYEITSSTNDVDLSSSLKSEIVSNSLVIDGNKTENYTISFKSENNETYSGKIVVGTRQEESVNFADLIKNNNEVKENPGTAIGSSSVSDEGLIKSTDDLGDAYYFRGLVTNNYVNFADKIWRIVKINGDGSVKVVLDNVIDVLTKYYDEDKTFSNSTIKSALDSWYNLNLSNYGDYIANYKFCNDLKFDDVTGNYASYNRIMKDKNAMFACLSENVNSKIGLLTADEVMLAGGSTDANTNYYLYNEAIKTDYYTMSSAKISTSYYPFIVRVDGAISDATEGTLLRSARPVINIVANVKTSGDGTINNPYQFDLK